MLQEYFRECIQCEWLRGNASAWLCMCMWRMHVEKKSSKHILNANELCAFITTISWNTGLAGIIIQTYISPKPDIFGKKHPWEQVTWHHVVRSVVAYFTPPTNRKVFVTSTSGLWSFSTTVSSDMRLYEFKSIKSTTMLNFYLFLLSSKEQRSTPVAFAPQNTKMDEISLSILAGV